MMKRPLPNNVSLFLKVLGDIFLILGFFAGVAYLMMASLFHIKGVYPHDYFGLAEIIIFGVSFLLVALFNIAIILISKKKLIPYGFIASSILSTAFLMYVFFVILAKMKIGGSESFFTTTKFAFTFFILWECALTIFSLVMPALLIKKKYFNSLLHSVVYIVEAVLWVVLFILMITRVSPTSGFILMAYLFLRSGLYWWLLLTKKEIQALE